MGAPGVAPGEIVTTGQGTALPARDIGAATRSALRSPSLRLIGRRLLARFLCSGVTSPSW